MKEGICKRLLGYDKDIVEIIQFGSSVYAPEYALDVDLLVITRYTLIISTMVIIQRITKKSSGSGMEG